MIGTFPSAVATVIGAAVLSICAAPANAAGCGGGPGWTTCPDGAGSAPVAQQPPDIDQMPIMRAKAADLQQKVRRGVLTTTEANLQYQEYRFSVIQQLMRMLRSF